MFAKLIEKLGKLNFDIKLRAGKKIPHADCLSRINTEDVNAIDTEDAFVNAIAIEAEQDNTNYGSRGWQLDKLQRVKLQESQQNDKLLKDVYSWVLNKKRPESRQMKNGASKDLWKSWVQYTNFCFIDGILYHKHHTEPNFETVYQMLVPWERVSNVLEQLHDSPSAGHFWIEKT